MQISPIIQNCHINLAPIRKNNISFGKMGLIKDVFQKTPEVKERRCKTTRLQWIVDSHPGISRETHLEEAKFIKKHKDLTLDDEVNLFEGIGSREFDINKLMLIAADNSLRQKGNAYIFGEETPKIFKGLDKKDVADSITKMLQQDEVKELRVGKKKFYVNWIDSGAVGGVYRISDILGRSVALKQYGSEWNSYNNGRVEIACSKQMTKDGVTDVPKFYMGNAIDYKFKENGRAYKAPMWLLTEYIKDNQYPKNNTKSYTSWLKEYGLHHEDDIGSNIKNDYLVDLGGICHYRHNVDRATSDVQYEILKNGLQQGMGVEGVFNFYKNYLLKSINRQGDNA